MLGKLLTQLNLLPPQQSKAQLSLAQQHHTFVEEKMRQWQRKRKRNKNEPRERRNAINLLLFAVIATMHGGGALLWIIANDIHVVP